MWESARKEVAEKFFHDRIALYRIDLEYNTIGESIEQEVLIGEFACNIQYTPTELRRQEVGESVSHSMRISLSKEVVLSYDKAYKIKILEARLSFDNSFWRVKGWTEGQISTVIEAVKEVIV